MAPLTPMPDRRLLRAYAYDPLFAELNDTIVTLSVPYEPLPPGPVGSLVKVNDYDPVRKVWYTPVELDDSRLLAQQGLAPSAADPRFHQQMVYAVASSVLEHFERGLGRRFRMGKHPIVLYPHAFVGENAYFDPARKAVLFGYFATDRDNPGLLLPGELVFTCLSHDIIAHELTHGIVDHLRPRLTEPSNHDVAAFHEAFADLVALFHHFTLPDLVRRYLQGSRLDLSTATPLVELARQFGEASGMHGPLRTALDRPDPKRLGRTLEPHDRGAILVAAIFAAFIDTYEARIADLVRIATGGTGQLPPGNLHPDLVARIADEAITNATRFLTICIRAFDYLPVVDVTFSDFLRALVTADRSLFPTDLGRKRAAIIEAFRRRGIYPDGIASPAEGSLLWADASSFVSLPGAVGELVRWSAEDFDQPKRGAPLSELANLFEERRARQRSRFAAKLHADIVAAPETFGLHPNTDDFPVRVFGFHASFRTGEDSQPRVDLVIQLEQNRPDLAARPELQDTGLQVWAGTTLITDSLGTGRYLITKPLPTDAGRPFEGKGSERFARICDFVSDRDALDLTRPWTNRPNRITQDLSFARLHADQHEALQ